MCCALCYFRNFHKEHKIIEIKDLNLKEENISIDNEREELNNIMKESNNLKEKILLEIDEINKTYQLINDEITKSFKIKHENLINKENDLKDLLKNEVTKTKEKLEECFTESNKSIKECERLNKIIKTFEKELKEINIIKYLSLIDHINNKKREIEKLFFQVMKNLKISYNHEGEYIKFDNLFFNGIKFPKDIEFKDIWIDSLKVEWKFDKINFINSIDEKLIKFRLEIKEQEQNDEFKLIYEGNNNYFKIVNLKLDQCYEIRICTLYKDFISSYSPIQKIKTLNVDSIILKESKKDLTFLKKIFEWTGYNKMELLYRSSRDGTKSQNFHEKCDNQGPTICLYKNEKGYIFGGYASISWTNNGNGYKRAPDCFIFTLTNIHETEPTKFKFKGTSDSVYHNYDHGAHFGGDIKIFNDFSNQDSRSQFPDDYEDTLNKGKSIFTGDLNNNNYEFKVKEIEVFKLLK